MVERIERVCIQRVIENKKEFAQGEEIPEKELLELFHSKSFDALKGAYIRLL